MIATRDSLHNFGQNYGAYPVLKLYIHPHIILRLTDKLKDTIEH